MEASSKRGRSNVHTCGYCQEFVATEPSVELGGNLVSLLAGKTPPPDVFSCPLFRFLRQTLSEYGWGWDDGRPARRLGYWLRRRVGFGPTTPRFSSESPLLSRRGHPRGYASDDEDIKLFKRSAAPGDPAAREVLERPPNSQVLTEQTLLNARAWIAECLQSHPCSRRRSTPARHVRPPSRLVEIQRLAGNPSARLVETGRFPRSRSGTDISWCALSYCWGGVQPVMTTTSTYADHLAEIPWASLPATLRDALTVAARLKMRYIWIDALCIVQDDEEDKAVECARMPNIYEHAKVTISAASAETCHRGFLAERLPQAICAVPYRCASGAMGSVLLSPAQTDQEPDPINLRGWTLQERLLSPRLLEFSASQVRWRCNRTVGNDAENTFPEQEALPALTGIPLHLNRSSEERRIHAYPQVFASANVNPLLNVWAHLVESYTERKLTVAADKLLAVSSIATRLAETKQPLGRYCADMWEDSLPPCLLWHPTSAGGGRRFTAYVAPSWSWASFDGPVGNLLESLYFSNPSKVRLLRCTVELAHASAPFGAVRAASMFLEGSVVRATVGEMHPGSLWPTHSVWLEHADHCINGHMDESLEPVGQGDGSYCIDLVWVLMVKGDEKTWSGLLLVKTDDDHERYRRVGWFDENMTAKLGRFWAAEPPRVLELI